MIQITRLPAIDRQPQAWKNGGGTTTEIAAAPPGAALDDFDWRLSMASVTIAGPFSRFDGIDRILAVVEGRLRLSFDGATVEIWPDGEPHAFPGDVEVVGAPVGGAVIDLNLMMRRHCWIGSVQRLLLPHALRLASPCAILLFTGEGSLRCGDMVIFMRPLDAVRIDQGHRHMVDLDGDGSAYVIALSQRNTGPRV